MHSFDRYFGSGPRIHLNMIALSVVVYYVRISFPWTRVTLWDGAQFTWASIMLALWILVIIWSLFYLGRKIGLALVTRGPYTYVRHPIYTAEIFFGWLVVFFVLNSWLALICMALTFYIAHGLVRYEEELLHQQFGDAWVAYAKKTPKLIPRFSKE